MKKFIILTAFFLAGLEQAGAQTVLYSNDFSGTGGNTAFTTENPDPSWTVTSGVYQYSTSDTSYTAATASVAIAGAAGVDFTMQTQFTVTSNGNVNSNGATVGFGLFGSDAGFTGANSSNSYYLADFQIANSGTPGTLRILSLGDTSGFSNTPTSVDDNAGSASLALNVGTTYTLKLTGTYSGSTLNMSLGLFDATGTTQIGTSAVASDTSVLAGTNFGYRNRIGLGGGTETVNFDNFSVTGASAIPEPGAAALGLGGVALVLAALRRRVRGGARRG